MTVTASYDDSAGAGHKHDSTASKSESGNIALRDTDAATAQDHAESLLAQTLPGIRPFSRVLTGGAPDADSLVPVSIKRTVQKPGLLSRVVGLGRWMRGIKGEEAVPHRSQLIAVRKAMEVLPPELREALTLVTVEGASYRQAADRLGIPVARLNSRVAQARVSLAEQLGLLPGASNAEKR